jgi:predicted lipid carrier protein YhbT
MLLAMLITAEPHDEMNLLGLFMKAALQERLPALERAKPSGSFLVESGGMTITLNCSLNQIVIRKGEQPHTDARLRGDLDALARLASGRMVDSFLRRRIRVSGNPIKLLPLARVFRGDG